jgi:hypothetical protein
VAAHTGELEDWWLTEERRNEIFWSAERFWSQWSSGQPLVALTRIRNRNDFETSIPKARFLECRGKWCVVANW